MTSTDALSADGLSFCEHVLEHRAEFAAFARRLSHDVSVTDDVTQLSLMRALRAWPRFEAHATSDTGVGQAVRAWMYLIVRNVYFSLHKGKRRERDQITNYTKEIHDSTVCTSAMDAFPQGAASDQLLEVIELLSPHHRQVIMLTYFFDMSVKELSVAIGVGRKTIETRLSRARDAMRNALAGYAKAEYGFTGASRRAGQAALEASEDLQADADGVDGVVAADDDGTFDDAEAAADHAPTW